MLSTTSEQDAKEAKGPPVNSSGLLKGPVSFREAGGGANSQEQYVLDLLRHTAEYIPEDRALVLIRSLAERGKDLMKEGFVNEVVNKYFEDVEAAPRSVTPHPKINEETTQTDEDNDIKRAIEESKKELSGNFTGDVDISRAIQQSLAESSQAHNNSYKRSLPENPRDLEKAHTELTGLFNIGNSCWFNCLAQLLYSIPEFRRIIYETVPDNWRTNQTWNGENVCERDLLLSLRRLFAMMEGSRRKYIDPSETVNFVSALQRIKTGENIAGRQQDAVEMFLKVIEWIEKALLQAQEEPLHVRVEIDNDCAIEGPSSHADSVCEMDVSPALSTDAMQIVPLADSVPSLTIEQAQFVVPALPVRSRMTSVGQPNSKSPLHHLLHGSMAHLRTNENGTRSEIVDVPSSLEVVHMDVSYGNLHDSMEAAQFGSKMEVWYKSLPPVLVFTPSRFQFRDNRVHKLHNRFSCPDRIYMDRYMYRNEKEVRSKHALRQEQRAELADIRSRLKGFDQFPVDGKTAPLQSLLESILQYFAEPGQSRECMDSSADPMDTSSCVLSPASVVPQASPSSVDKSPKVSSDSTTTSVFPLPGPVPYGPPNKNEAFPTSCGGKEVIETSSFVQQLPTVLPFCESLSHEKRQETLTIFQRALEDARSRENALREHAAYLEKEIECAFESPEFQTEEYRLHCVIIHEGDANVGHYWAYVRDSTNGERWLKMNDKSVESCSREALERDALGGVERSSSAYCYVYVRESADWIFDFGKTEQVTASESGDNLHPIIEPPTLPEDLAAIVDDDTREFQDMIAVYEERMLRDDWRSRYLIDPDEWTVSLADDVRNILTDADCAFITTEIEKHSAYLSHFVEKPMLDIIRDQSVELYTSIGHHIVYYVDKDLAESDAMTRGCKTVCKVLSEWFTIYQTLQPPARGMDDMRCNVITWWHEMGHKLPSKVAKLALATMLANGGTANATKEAARETLKIFNQQPNSNVFHMLFSLMSVLYEILACFWAVFKEAFNRISQTPRLPRHDNSNAKHLDALNKAHTDLRWASFALSIYEYLLAANAVLTPLNTVDIAKAIIPPYRMKTIAMIGAVVMSARLCVILVRGCSAARTDFENEESAFTGVLQRIAWWAKFEDDGTARKVIDAISNQWGLLASIESEKASEQDEKLRVLKNVTSAIRDVREGRDNFTDLFKGTSIKVRNPALISDVIMIENKCANCEMHSEAACDSLLDGLLSDAMDVVCHYVFP